jgi:hypothetical protein
MGERSALDISNSYNVRIYESSDGKGSTSAGTTVALSVRTFNIYAETAGEVESTIRRRVLAGVLSFGKVYQICPGFGNPEFIRSIAVLSDGSFERVFLDPAPESHGEFRCIRLAKTTASPEMESAINAAEDLESLADGAASTLPRP